MAARVPLAGLMNLSRNSGGTDTQMDASVQTMLAQAPGNALVWGEIAEQGGWFLLPHAARLAALAKRFPGCYNLARAQEALARHTHDLAAQDAAARRMVRDAPRNPNAWLSLEKSLSDQSEAIRQGRVFDDLTPPEVNIVTRLYPQAQRAAAHATALDPCDSDAWTIFAEDATFNSDSRTADTAIKKALRLPGNKADAYRWGLQMYQPKWGGDPAMLARVAHRAAYDATLNDNQTLEVAYDVEESGFAPLAQQGLASWIARRRAQIAARPQVGWLHWGLATVLNKRGDGPGSDREFATAEALMPGVAAVHFDHADALSRRDNHNDAIREYQDGLRLDPQNRSAHKDLGWEYKHAGRLDEAVRELTLALHIDPYNGLAHYYLGDVRMLQNRPAEAAQEYRAAARDVVYKASLQRALAYALNTAGQTDAAIAAGLDAIRLDPRSDGSVYATVADASLHKHDWDTALRMSESALSINAQDSVAHENMAEAYLGKGDLPHARAEWQAVLTLGDPRMTALAQEYLRKYP